MISECPASDIAVPCQIEADVRERLRLYLHGVGQSNLEKNLEELLSLEGGFTGRFCFFLPKLDSGAKERILISGCGVGSELIVARRLGFSEVHGTEVVPELVAIGQQRLRDFPGCSVVHYDGTTLPFSAEHFTTIYSGHVIEHTPSPRDYFAEHMRVLRCGGYFFLEFPNRYHWRELHTGKLSFEWLPKPLRSVALRVASSPVSPLPAWTKHCYRIIRSDIQPMSLWQIRRLVAQTGRPASKVVAVEHPTPGFLRVLVRK